MPCSRGCCPDQQSHFRSINLAPSATPSRHPQAVEVKTRESQWNKDMPAYKRMRDNGLQPPHIDGCAELESRASTQAEVELGRVLSADQIPFAVEGMESARQLREDADV